MVDNDTGTHFLCTWGVLGLFEIGKTQWTRLKTCNSSWETKLVGNKNANVRMEDVFVSIDTFLTDLKVEADPMATRIIRAKVGLACRGDTDEVKLAPHFKYRKIYESWVLERGWVTKLESRDIGNYSPASEFGVRPHDDESDYPSWLTGSQQKDICSFRSFMRQWGKTHPELRIRPRGGRHVHPMLAVDGGHQAQGISDEWGGHGSRIWADLGSGFGEDDGGTW